MNYRLKITLATIIMALVGLGGCSVHTPDNYTPTTVNQVDQAIAWEMQGKLALKTKTDNASTNLYWLHTSKSDELRLTTMLGTSVLSLVSNEQGATLKIDGKTYRHNNTEQLLQKLTGWSIPIKRLPLWITGQLSPDDQVISRDAMSRPKLVHTTKNDPPWQVSFRSWQQQSGSQIPKLLALTSKGIRLKIQINHWQALAVNDK